MARPVWGDALDAANPSSPHYRDPVLAALDDERRYPADNSPSAPNAITLTLVAAMLGGIFYLTVLL